MPNALESSAYIAAELMKRFPQRFPGRLFRRNVARVADRNGNYFRCALPGQADLWGFVTINSLAVLCEVEIKVGRDKMSDLQISWLNLVKKMGGITVIAHGVEQALAAVEYQVKEIQKGTI